MVHHIVMWKFKPEVEDAKKPELKKAMAENLKSLVGKVPGLLTVDFVEAPLASSPMIWHLSQHWKKQRM